VPGGSVRFSANTVESVGAKYHAIDVTRTDAPAVGEWAAQIASRAQGLREPLKVVEVDTTESVATLRSAQPTTRSSTTGYYELVLSDGSEAQLQRYEVERDLGSPRVAVPFALTHEATAEFVETIFG